MSSARQIKIGVLCSGRGSNFRALAQKAQDGYFPRGCLTLMVADAPAIGALAVADEYGVPATVLDYRAYKNNGGRETFETDLVALLKKHDIDLVVLAGFERLIGEPIVTAYPNKIINIHPALLPAFPGLSVWGAQAEYGVKLAGATVHFVDEGMDSGPIIVQGAVPADPELTPDELATRILSVEHSLLPQAVKWFTEGRLSLEGRRVKLAGHPPYQGEALIWPPLD